MINAIYPINHYQLQIVNINLQHYYKMRNKDVSNIILNQNYNIKVQLKEILASNYYGQCNFLIFINTAKPYIHRVNKECFVKRHLNLE